MVVVKVILTILFLLVCVAMVAVVMLQEGKSGGLGSALSGGAAAEGTFWSKNKDRSLEGKLPKITKWLAVAFFVFAIVLNLF